MAFAGDLTLVQVRDSWLKADGSPQTGTITFTPATKFKDTLTGQQIANTTVQVALVDGLLSVYLPASDDEDYTPTGFTYAVSVNLDGGYRESYDLLVPSSAASTGIDLGLTVPVDSSPGVVQPATGGGGTTPSDPLLELAYGGVAWLLLP